VKHRRISNGPNLDGTIIYTIHKDGQPTVNRSRKGGVTPRFKNWGSSGIGINAGKVTRRKRKTAFGII
jgi:hypothetical protein